MTIGYQASHEQFAPSELVKYAVAAEKAGFKAIHSSDHFHPWSKRQGHSGFAWAWMGAAMQATTIPFSAICVPGQRYHPAIVAQAIATLSELFPSRFIAELGSGEAINEKITGESWPLKSERNQRLAESAEIIRKLLEGEEITYKGFVTVHEAKLYTRPAEKPPLFCAAISEQTAEWAGSWADGLVTVGSDVAVAEKVINAFKEGGGEGKPVFLKLDLSYAQTKAEAMDGAFDQWRTNVLPSNLLGDLRKVEHFDAAATFIRPEDVAQKVKILWDIEECKGWLNSFAPLNADRLVLHNVNRMQQQFIEDFGEKVLPFL